MLKSVVITSIIISLGFSHYSKAAPGISDAASEITYSMFLSQERGPEDQDILITARTKDIFSFKKCLAFLKDGTPTEISQINRRRFSEPENFKEADLSQLMMAKYFNSSLCTSIGHGAYGFTDKELIKSLSHGRPDLSGEVSSISSLALMFEIGYFVRAKVADDAKGNSIAPNFLNLSRRSLIRISGYSKNGSKLAKHSLFVLIPATLYAIYDFSAGDMSKENYETKRDIQKNAELCDVQVVSSSSYQNIIFGGLKFDSSDLETKSAPSAQALSPASQVFDVSRISKCTHLSMKNFISNFEKGLNLAVEQKVFIPL